MNVRIWWLPTPPATPGAPTQAELDAGIELAVGEPVLNEGFAYTFSPAVPWDKPGDVGVLHLDSGQEYYMTYKPNKRDGE